MLDEERLRRLSEKGGLKPGPQCLSDEDLSRTTDPASKDAAVLLDHVVACDWCGERLRLLLTVGEELSAEEASVLAALAKKRGQPRIWRFLPAIAAVILVGAAGLFTWNYFNRPERRAERLLAEAYTQQRRFEWRLPDRGWARKNLERSPTPRPLHSLTEAQELLSRDGESVGAAHLDLSARAELLEFHIDNAVRLLEQATSHDQKSPALLTDLAVAYALRAESQNRPADYAAVVEAATRALKLDPHYGRALFNRALAYERLSMVDQAIADWQSFLQTESDQGWIREAREKMAALEQLRNRRGALRRLVDQSDAALERAAFDWLVEDRGRARTSGAELERRYNDTWLRDASAEPVDSLPLRTAVDASLANRADDVLADSHRNALLYRAFPAHLARFRLEEVFALNRRRDSGSCLERADALIRDLSTTHYHWIRVQARMYRSSCLSERGDYGGSRSSYQTALEEARIHGLEGLELRAIGTLTNSRITGGDPWPAWQDNRSALARIVVGPYALARVRECLVNYAMSAEQMGLHAAGMVFARAAADSLRESPNRMGEAANRMQAASMAMAAGFNDEALAESRLVEQLVANVPDSETRTRYLDSMRLLQAQALLRTGRPRDALALIPPSGPALVSREIWMANQVAGAALLALNQPGEARQRLEKAIFEGEARAQSHSTAAERAAGRREGLEAYRLLAGILVDQGSSSEALNVWLAAHGSQRAPDLVFLALEDGYAVWSGPRFARIRADRRQVASSIHNLTDSAGDPGRSVATIQHLGRELFERLLEPVADSLCNDPVLTVLPDAELAQLPFQLLVGRDGRWLADRQAIVFAAAPAKAPWSSDGHGLIVGNPASPDAPAPIPEFASESDAARSTVHDAVVLTGTDASYAEVTRRLPEVQLFHFAGHGFASSGHGAVYLADEPLTALSIRRLTLDRRLVVVLSACLTAIGENAGLANSESLVRSFLDAGAAAVVASRWPVESAATAQLMQGMYADLTRVGVARALHGTAGRLASDPNFKHPYYWAAFQLYE